jgi:hypothetical protein
MPESACVLLPSTSSTYVRYVCVGLGRKPRIFKHLRPLATNAGEKVRLAFCSKLLAAGASRSFQGVPSDTAS